MRRFVFVMLVCGSVSAAACPDAGTELPPALWASSARLLQPDGGVVDPRGPGCWLPETRCESEGCELANLREQNVVLRATPPLFSVATWAAVGVAAAIAIALGLFGGWELRGLFGGR